MAQALLALAVLLAQSVETVTGFGGTVLALSLGAQVVPLPPLVVALVAVGWLQSAWLVARGRAHVAWGVLLRRILPLAGVGLAGGAVAGRLLDATALQRVLGAFVVVTAGVALWRVLRAPQAEGVPASEARRAKPTEGASSPREARSGNQAPACGGPIAGHAPRPLPAPAGAALLLSGGVVHGLLGSGGPLIVAFAIRAVPGKDAFRATLSVLWLVLNSVLLAHFAWSGRVDADAAGLFWPALPALVAGIALGEWLHARVSEAMFGLVAQGVLLVTGVLLLVSP